VSEGRNGFIVPAEDPGALAARIGSLIESTKLRERFGSESLSMVGRWTPERTVEGIVSAAYAASGRTVTAA
jgi:hypothetical protein